MTDKFDYYDLLSSLIPGVLLLGWVAICFPGLVQVGSSVNFPSAFATILLIALSLFLGQIIQAVASIAEPVIYRTWGGRPSDTALQDGLKGYLPIDTAARVRRKLEEAIGEQSESHSLFLFAIQNSDSLGLGRAKQFNSLYAYHRGLFVVTLISDMVLILSLLWGSAFLLTIQQKIVSFCGLFLLTALFWYRAKQRAFYYVREVLLTAERVIDERNAEEE